MDVGGFVWPFQIDWAVCWWSAMDMSNYDHFITVCDQIISGVSLCHIVMTEDLAKHVQSEGFNIASAVGSSFCVR
jgi:hypothetical protein